MNTYDPKGLLAPQTAADALCYAEYLDAQALIYRNGGLTSTADYWAAGAQEWREKAASMEVTP